MLPAIINETYMNNPLISIITVVYNAVNTLEQTILSVINQTYKNIEYIIIDGGSSDGTIDIIKKYEKYLAYWVSEPDKGIYDAMNKGIDRATGDYIALLNSDDWYEMNACEIVVNKINDVRADIYYGMMRVIDKNNITQFVYGYTDIILNKQMIAHPTCFISKDIYINMKYNILYKSAADYDFMIRLKNKNYTFVFIECIMANYRLDGMSDSLIGISETNNIKWKYRFIDMHIYIFKKIYFKFFITKK